MMELGPQILSLSGKGLRVDRSSSKSCTMCKFFTFCLEVKARHDMPFKFSPCGSLLSSSRSRCCRKIGIIGKKSRKMDPGRKPCPINGCQLRNKASNLPDNSLINRHESEVYR